MYITQNKGNIVRFGFRWMDGWMNGWMLTVNVNNMPCFITNKHCWLHAAYVATTNHSRVQRLQKRCSVRLEATCTYKVWSQSKLQGFSSVYACFL